MLHPDVKQLLMEQINKELYSAYLYLAMADYYAASNLDGFANWFNIQAQEERDHAMLFREYLNNQAERVRLTAVAAPEDDFKAYDEPLKAAYAHECLVTASIHNIYSVAFREKDFRTMQFLDWFVKEQGEEEKNADDLVQKFRLYGTDAKSLYMLNSELGARVYAPPSLVL